MGQAREHFRSTSPCGKPTPPACKTRQVYARAGLALLLGSLLLLAPQPGSATSARKLARKQLTQEQLVEMVSRLAADDIAVPPQPQVLKWVNRLIASPHSRETLRASLDRLKANETTVRKKLEEGRLPLGLLVIPLQESGYQNISSRTGAGIWQLVKDTGRRYGLKVPASLRKRGKKAPEPSLTPPLAPTPELDVVDERLDPEKSTQAALALLSDLHARYPDWHLTLLAYNIGEGALAKAIRKAKSRDAFQIIKLGGLKPSQKAYLPKALALLLIIRNPDLIAD